MTCSDNLPQTALYVDMEVDDFAQFVFLRNVNDAAIELSLGGVENNKDLFCFMVDLLCKGLVLMFGSDNRVEVESLTLDDFGRLKKKLACAGINVHLSVTQNSESDIIGINMHELNDIPDESPLSDFTLKLTSITFIYHIKFSLCHKVI